MQVKLSTTVAVLAPETQGFSDARPRPSSRRLALWEIGAGMQCAIVGTCLSDADLLAALRKHRLKIDRAAQSYDIHSSCVRAASQNSPFSRTLTKLLDRRFAGAIRQIGRTEAGGEMLAIWMRLRDAGQVAAGYWAIMSHSHVPEDVKVRVFGEVHMLSHLNGYGANQLALRLDEAERKTAELELRLKRCEKAKLEALAERDAARSAVADGAAQVNDGNRRAPESPASPVPVGGPRLHRKLAKCTRALISARGRARHAEETIARLSGRPATTGPSPLARERQGSPNVRSPASWPQLQQRILYLGGRTAIVPHLRQVAEAHAAAFLHHDGGVEDSLHRIDDMVEHCDAVVCPVDCISHGACRMAKAACQRLNKRFLPIPTASRAGFERALEQLSRLASAPDCFVSEVEEPVR